MLRHLFRVATESLRARSTPHQTGIRAWSPLFTLFMVTLTEKSFSSSRPHYPSGTQASCVPRTPNTRRRGLERQMPRDQKRSVTENSVRHRQYSYAILSKDALTD
ncbi:hypothetical protein BJX62DRAFT_115306 [Aspergillus germanicus]